ncbi:MAG: dockerin type I domain-containing protein [Candidatus Zixiibacteriota bacterium]
MNLTLNQPFCVYQPFFLEIDYLSRHAVDNVLPGFLMDDSVAPTDTCNNWGVDGLTYYKWSDFWFPPPPGDVIIRASGYTHDLECDSCGDVNADGVKNVGDIVYLINYLFKDGPSPNPLGIGDVNLDGVVNVGDVVYLVNYLFKNGPPPCG